MWRNKTAPVAPNDVGKPNPDDAGVPAAPDRVATGDANHGITQGIAQGIRIIGDIKGRHDLTIAGEVAGSVFLPDNHVHVLATAVVRASITARIIEVEGAVTGDLNAAEMVVIAATSRVSGDIFSPQIRLEEGCQFRGSVQMRRPELARKPRMTGEPGDVRYRAANE